MSTDQNIDIDKENSSTANSSEEIIEKFRIDAEGLITSTESQQDFDSKVVTLKRDIRNYILKSNWAKGKFISSISFSIFTSFGISKAIRRWLEVTSRLEPFPTKETSEVITSIVNRILGLNMFTIVVGSMGSFAIIMQIFLINKQTQIFVKQLKFQQSLLEIERENSNLSILTAKNDNCAQFDVVGADEKEHSYPTSYQSCESTFSGTRRSAALISEINSQLSLSDGSRCVGLFGLTEKSNKSHWATIDSANLSRLDLFEHDLRCTHFISSDFTNTTFSRSNLDSARFLSSNLSGTKFGYNKHRRVELINVFVSKDNPANFEYSRFGDFLYSYLSVWESSLSNSNFKWAYLKGAHFFDTNLSGADFTGANLVEVIFIRSNLENAILKAANIEGADLYRAEGLNCEQVKEATNWELANLPAGMSCSNEIEEIEKGTSVKDQQ